MKKHFVFVALIIVGIIFISLIGVNFVYAENAYSNCMRACTEYKKVDMGDCSSTYTHDLKDCNGEYKNCLKNKTLSKKCLKDFNDCKKTTNVIKKNCDKKSVSDFFNCKADCLNPRPNCVGEGNGIPVIPNAPECCEGLKLIPPREEFLIGLYGICTSKCGNGFCDSIESNYNCAQDCNISEENFCGVCGFECTTNRGSICPMVMGNFRCEILDNVCSKIIPIQTL